MQIEDRGAKVLVVDDNPANIDILLELLDGYDVRAVLDGKSALEAVNEELPDLILLDIAMPGMDGFEVCRRLKSSPRTKEIPVIFLSANNDDASVLNGFEVGGVDYITKPYRAKEVLARVKTHIQLFLALRKLEKIATTDALTGISNRRKFFMRAPRLIEQAKAKNVSLFLAVIDIDKFKSINDRYGHAVGDEVLKAVANVAKEMLPSNTCFARLGGDEFTMMLGGDESKVLKVYDRLRIMMEKTSIPGSDVKATLSIGVSKLSSKDENVNALIRRADEALYVVKENGGNGLEVKL